MKNKILLFILAFSFIFVPFVPIEKVEGNEKEIVEIINNTKKVLEESIEKDNLSSWTIFGLNCYSDLEKNTNIDKYNKKYIKDLGKTLKENDGVLHNRKYTEYSKHIIALNSIGADVNNIEGYNLLTYLADYEKVIWQGINGPVFALIALDSGNYEIPKVENIKTKATREMYVGEILNKQLKDGSFSLSGETGDVDTTAMTLQALSKYRDNSKVEKAIEKGLDYLSISQERDGGYKSYNIKTAESTAQVLSALMELGIDIEDERFVKNNNTVIDDLKSYYIKDKGFRHTLDTNEDLMATEQSFYSLVSYIRVEKGLGSIYNKKGNKKEKEKIEEIKIGDKPFIFKDIINHKNQKAIENLYKQGIISGVNVNEFMPDNNITRGEFTTIVVRGLGLEIVKDNPFEDVEENSWYAPYVSTAYKNRIVSGRSEYIFAPNENIKMEEAAVLLAQVAKLYTDTDVKNMDNLFKTYNREISPWAEKSVAYLVENNIITEKINPKENASRGEVAQMFYNLINTINIK